MDLLNIPLGFIAHRLFIDLQYGQQEKHNSTMFIWKVLQENIFSSLVHI